MEIKEYIINETDIDFMKCHDIIEKFNNVGFENHIIINVKNIKYAHSAFIGFLIYVKTESVEQGGKLEVVLSHTLKKQLDNIKVLAFLRGEI